MEFVKKGQRLCGWLIPDDEWRGTPWPRFGTSTPLRWSTLGVRPRGTIDKNRCGDRFEGL